MPGMENGRDDIHARDILDDPALSSAEGRTAAVASPADEVAPPNADQPAAMPRAKRSADRLTDDQRRQMHASFNDRVSYLCKLAALIMALVAFATMALGQELPRFVLMGLCLSVALLAIASLQDYHQRKH